MTKLIATALLSVGFAAAAMAADMPKTAAPMSVDAPAAGTTSTAGKPAAKGKHGGKKGKKAPAPSTTK
jgi:opacity protein-like surface antigen